MATKKEVKQYLAYWFQLGKKVIISKGEVSLLPKPVLKGEGYSKEFEDCWQKILSQSTGESYLEGTSESIRELLTPNWEILPCGRCSMLVPIRTMGMPPLSCPCSDIAHWPNTELPAPRSPIDSREKLKGIAERLHQLNGNFSLITPYIQ